MSWYEDNFIFEFFSPAKKYYGPKLVYYLFFSELVGKYDLVPYNFVFTKVITRIDQSHT